MITSSLLENVTETLLTLSLILSLFVHIRNAHIHGFISHGLRQLILAETAGRVTDSVMLSCLRDVRMVVLEQP